MRKLQFTGLADKVEYSADDLKRSGVNDQKKVSFNKDNNFTVEVSDAAAELLLKDKRFSEVQKQPSQPQEGEDVPASASSPESGTVESETST